MFYNRDVFYVLAVPSVLLLVALLVLIEGIFIKEGLAHSDRPVLALFERGSCLDFS